MSERPSESWKRRRFGYPDLTAILGILAAMSWLISLYW